MAPISLGSEPSAQTDGAGPVISVAQQAGRLLVLTLAITRSSEQSTLNVSVWGSVDQTSWGAKPVAAFPEKSYCGLYSILLNLAGRPEIKYLRVKWKMGRWRKGSPSPVFEFYVDAELSGARIPTTSAGSSGGLVAVEMPTHALAS